MTKVQDPLRYLHSLKGLGIRPDLIPLSLVLKRFRHPERDYPTVLIAGTNGKGSVAAMVASILHEAGLRVGLYTSPHLRDYRERIRVDGRMITRRDLRDLIRAVRENLHDDLTYFEFSTLLAFIYFSRCPVDMAVLEVGMGGRFDATNLVTPEVSVITNISLEHQEYLGCKVTAIAREKGGIIKDGGTCLTGVRQKKAIAVLEGICREKGASFYRLGGDIRVRMPEPGVFSYAGIGKCYRRLEVPLRGRHQVENAALATGVAEILSARGFRIDEQAVTRGLKKTRWEGRIEILGESPALVVDGAHNPAGITVLRRALEDEFSFRRLILVFGVLRDKDYRTMLRRISPIVDQLILTRPGTERALPARDLKAVLPGDAKGTLVEEDPREALREAFRLAGKKDLICATGSLYLVGDIKKAFLRGMKKTGI